MPDALSVFDAHWLKKPQSIGSQTNRNVNTSLERLTLIRDPVGGHNDRHFPNGQPIPFNGRAIDDEHQVNPFR